MREREEFYKRDKRFERERYIKKDREIDFFNYKI